MPQPAFGLLGPLDVRIDGRVVAIGSRKQRVLLCALLATPGRVVPTATLVELLWGDDPPTSVAVTLRSVASRLRAALGPEGDRVRADDGGYVARVDPETLDTRAFEELAARGRALLGDDRSREAVAVLTRAAGLWRGPALADVGEAGPLRPVVERLDAARRDLVEDLVEAHLAADDPAAALALLDPHLAADPLREHARGLQMLAFYRLGRQTEALAAYRALRAILRDDLGVDPHPDLRTLHQRILRQDPTLSPVRAVRQLPAALTPLVGRDEERARIRALLREARLVTLTGVGGVGKTRLALQVAADVLTDYPDGVRLVELGPLHDPAGVAAHLAAALGATEDALYGQRLLAVVDNCEHVVTAAATAVDRLLRTAPGITVLATSRVPLGLGGEVRLPVPPLSLPPPDAADPEQLTGFDAVTLFCQRARATQPGFGLTADNAAAVAEICRRLDGLPLALELAASRMRALSSTQLAVRLGDRFRLLTAGDPTAPARQQTLRATIDWSYRLLAPAEQAALCALTVFPAGFDLDAAEAVVGPGALFALVDKSVVATRQRAGQMRYELLESIRSFALEQAQPEEIAVARRRHLEHFAAIVERERRKGTNWDSVAWCRTVTAEEPNLRAAIATALGFDDVDAALRVACGYWVHCLWGGRAEPLDWLGDALAAETRPHADLAARSEGLVALAVFTSWWELGTLEQSAALYAEARRVADHSGDDHCRARVRFFDAEYRSLRGDHDAARAEYHQAIRLAGDNGIARWCHHSLAWLALAAGDTDRAAAELRHILATGAPDELVVPHADAALAVLCAAAGETTEAGRHAERAVDGAAPFELVGIQIMTLVRAAQAHTLCLHRTGSGADVLRGTLTRLFDRLRRAGIRQFIAESLELAAVAAERAGAVERAARYLGARDAVRVERAEPGPALPALAAVVDDARARIRAALGERAFDAAVTAAARLPTHDVVADVRAWLRP